MLEKVFVYGTLMKEDVQKKVIGRRLVGVNDILFGYEKTTVRINENTYPIISKIKGENFIEGITIDVTSGELKKLDEYETSAYVREKVTLQSGIVSWVYQ